MANPRKELKEAQREVNMLCKRLVEFTEEVERALRECKRVDMAGQLSELVRQVKGAVRKHDSEVARQFRSPRETN
jgi:hypothetical protein